LAAFGGTAPLAIERRFQSLDGRAQRRNGTSLYSEGGCMVALGRDLLGRSFKQLPLPLSPLLFRLQEGLQGLKAGLQVGIPDARGWAWTHPQALPTHDVGAIRRAFTGR